MLDHLLLVSHLDKHMQLFVSSPLREGNERCLSHVVGTGGSQAQVTSTRPRSGSANALKAPGLTSKSVGWQPTPKAGQSVSLVEASVGIAIQRSTTVKSMLSPLRTALSLWPQSGFAFGLEPLETASKVKWLMDTMWSVSEEVTPQAPSPGP